MCTKKVLEITKEENALKTVGVEEGKCVKINIECATKCGVSFLDMPRKTVSLIIWQAFFMTFHTS